MAGCGRGGGQEERTPAMRREQRRHGDFIFVPKPSGSVADYRSIVYKTFALVQWVAVHSRPRFVVKTDDDAYVHTGNLVAALRKVGLCAQSSVRLPSPAK